MVPDTSLQSLAIAQLWQLSIVLVCLGSIALVLGKRRPHLAYALWLVVLIKAITPPLWSSNLGLFGHLTPIAWNSRPEVAINHSESPITASFDSRQTPTVESELPMSHVIVPAQPDNPLRFAQWVFVTWIVGVLAMVALSVAAVAMRRRSLRLRGTTAPPELVQLLTTLRHQLGISQSVNLVVTRDNLGPALCGIWKPIILLPEGLMVNRTAHALQPVLVHELIHLRRRDHIVTAVQCLVQILWWFHPLVWWSNRAITRVRERCCDAESISALEGKSSQYARCLLDVLSSKASLRHVYGLPGVRPVDVTMRRVKEIMEMKNILPIRTSFSNVALVLVAALIVLPGASLIRSAPATADEAAPKVATEKRPADRDRLLLKYGDGKADGKKSIAGAGEMIRFEAPSDNAKIKAVRVHGARYGYPQPPQEDIEVSILTDDMSEVLHTELVPYSLFKRVSKNRWTHLPFREPVEVPKNFWVVLNFNAERTKGVYVSYDTSTKGEYSRVGLSDEDSRETDFGGDWMVHVLLAD